MLSTNYTLTASQHNGVNCIDVFSKITDLEIVSIFVDGLIEFNYPHHSLSGPELIELANIAASFHLIYNSLNNAQT